MQIPNANRAVIDPVKLHWYLLSRSHPVGRFKAAFFHALGYSLEELWRQLEEDPRSQHLSRDVTLENQTFVWAEILDPSYPGWAIGEIGGRVERLDRAHR